MKLRSYKGRFFRLKVKFFNEVNLLKRAKIKKELESLLSLVQKLGELSKPLETEIYNFIHKKQAVRITPSRLADMLQSSIESREKEVVITIHPKHHSGGGLAGKITRREGSAISSMSTLRKQKSNKIKPDIKRERFKPD